MSFKRILFIRITIILLLTVVLSLVWQNTLKAALIINHSDYLKVVKHNLVQAKGNVKAIYDNYNISTQSLIYNKTKGKIYLLGNTSIIDVGDKSLILGNKVTIDVKTNTKTIHNAKFDRNNYQITAESITISPKRLQAENSYFTTCKLCTIKQVPSWKFHSKKIVQSDKTHRIYFYDSKLYMSSVPIFYLPYVSTPSQGVSRADGLLIPKIGINSLLGYYASIPYFLTLGQNKDLTIRPILLSKVNSVLALRYRQAFRDSSLIINTSLTENDKFNKNIRGNIFLDFTHKVNKYTDITVNIKNVSDFNYLREYPFFGYSGDDSIVSNIIYSNRKNKKSFNIFATRYQDLTSNKQLLNQDIVGLNYENYYQLKNSTLHLYFDTHSISAVDYKQLNRSSLLLENVASTVLDNGIVAKLNSSLNGDVFNSVTNKNYKFHLLPKTSLYLSYPLIKQIKDYYITLSPMIRTNISLNDNYIGELSKQDNFLPFSYDNFLSDTLLNYQGNTNLLDKSSVSIGFISEIFYSSQNNFTFFVGKDILLDKIKFNKIDKSFYNLSVRYNNHKIKVKSANEFYNSGDLAYSNSSLNISSFKNFSFFINYIMADKNIVSNNNTKIKQIYYGASYRLTNNTSVFVKATKNLYLNRTYNKSMGLSFENDCFYVNIGIEYKYYYSNEIRNSRNLYFTIALKGLGLTPQNSNFDL